MTERIGTVNRRELLKIFGMSSVGAFASAALASRERGQGSTRPRVIQRFAYLSDCHLPAQGQNDAVKRAFRFAQTKFGRLDFVIFGGDNIFAADIPQKSNVVDQFDNWRNLVASSVTVPSYSLIGNHDLWGLSSYDVHARADCKSMALQAYGMPNRYYSFGRNGWRFIALDTVQVGRTGYYGGVDEPQVDWLKSEFAAHKEPTVVFGHIPILSVTALSMDHPHRTSQSPRVSHTQIVSNGVQLIELFRENPQVKLCLSGHMHMIDQVRFHNTDYVCSGAVSGAWWKGEHQHFAPNFTVVDILDNGSTMCRNVAWNEK